MKNSTLIRRITGILLFLFSVMFSKFNSPAIPPNTESENQDLLSICTYNVWALPIQLPGHNQGTRIDQLPDHIISSNLDIITLQETFNSNLRRKMVETAKGHYNMHSDYLADRSLLDFDRQGGLMTLSRYPIVQEQFYPYSKQEGMNLVERMAKKGFLMTTIIYENQSINVVNTHLYAGNHTKAENIRLLQIQEMHSILDTTVAFHQYPTVLTGDLNINHPDIAQNDSRFAASPVYDYITETMEFCDSAPHIERVDCTIDCKSNPFKNEDDAYQKLDYILYHIPQTSCADVQVVDQNRYFDTEALSDHYAWKVDIRL